MKICFLTYNIFSQGGVQRVVTNLSNELSKEHNIDIICTVDDTPIDSKLYGLNTNKIKIDVKVERINILEKISRKFYKEINNKLGILNNKYCSEVLGNLLYPKSLRKELIRYLNAKNYDVIIGVEAYFSLLLGLISPKINAKTIGWEHNSYDAYLKMKGKRYYYNLDNLFRHCIPKLDKHIVLTQYDKDKYEKELQIKSEVIYNQKSFICSKPTNFSNKTFISVGRLERAKGFDLLIDAFYEFSQNNDEWILNIIGEGPERNYLQTKINKLNLNERIFLLGAKNNIIDYYVESTIYLSSSRWEGLPLVLIEAMECGLPIISFDYPAANEIINDHNGIIIQRFNINNFAEKMNLLGNDI